MAPLRPAATGGRATDRRRDEPVSGTTPRIDRSAATAEDACRRAVESAVDAFVALDADGTIVEWNAQAELLFGFARHEVLGRQLALDGNDAGGPELTTLVDEGAPLAGRRMLTRVVARDGRSVPVEMTVWGSDGRAGSSCNAFFRVVETATPDQLLCRVGAIVESSDAAISSHGLDGRILTWNRAAERVYGYRASEIVGQPASLLVPADRHDEVEQGIDAARRGDSVASHETLRRRKDGSMVDVAVTVSPVYDDVGRVVGVSTIARDITEQRRMAAALERALEEARQAEARSRQFLADAAHQLRTPVAGIWACADSLLRSGSTAARERLLAHLIDEASRTSRLVNDLLRVARLDQGEEEAAPAETDVAGLCLHEAERAGIQAAHLDLVVRADDRFPASAYVDAGALREILANVVDNACRYARARVELHLRAGEGSLEISVLDDGPGLPPAMVDVAFERFTTLDAKGGSGLGLAIARGLARARGGELTYEDGAFVLRMPVPPEVTTGAC